MTRYRIRTTGVAVCLLALFLASCAAPNNLKVPQYPAKLQIAVSNADASETSHNWSFSFRVPDSQVSYMSWPVMNRRWLNIDVMTGAISRAVQRDLGADEVALKGKKFDKSLSEFLRAEIAADPSNAGMSVSPSGRDASVKLFPLALLSSSTVGQVGLEFELIARGDAGGGNLNRTFFYSVAGSQPLASANGASWLGNGSEALMRQAEVAYARLAKLYLMEVTGKLGKDLDESKLKRISWPAVRIPGGLEYGLLVEVLADHAIVIRVHDDNGNPRRDLGILERPKPSETAK
jgi:hypothetical protein